MTSLTVKGFWKSILIKNLSHHVTVKHEEHSVLSTLLNLHKSQWMLPKLTAWKSIYWVAVLFSIFCVYLSTKTFQNACKMLSALTYSCVITRLFLERSSLLQGPSVYPSGNNLSRNSLVITQHQSRKQSILPNFRVIVSVHNWQSINLCMWAIWQLCQSTILTFSATYLTVFRKCYYAWQCHLLFLDD